MADHEKLTTATKAALLLANALGIINIPCGRACESEALFGELCRLEKMGFLTRAKEKEFYRPFTLTQRGDALKYLLSQPAKVIAG